MLFFVIINMNALEYLPALSLICFHPYGMDILAILEGLGVGGG